MNIEEFEKRAKSIVEDELKNIKTIVKNIPDPKAKDQVHLLGLETIDVDIKKNPLAFDALKTFVANLMLEQLKNKSENIDYEQIIANMVSHIMTFCVGYKSASLKSPKKYNKVRKPKPIKKSTARKNRMQ
jgi:hypothetical protein